MRALLILLVMSAVSARAAATNALGSLGTSTAGQVPYFRDTSGQLIAATSSLTNLTLVTPTLTGVGGSAFRVGFVLTGWPATDNSVGLAWRRAPAVYEYAAGNGELTAITINSATASSGAVVDADEVGVASLSTGTLTNGQGGYRGGVSAIRTTTASTGLHYRFKAPSALSSNADGYQLIVGFGDVNAAEALPTDGAYFYYSHLAASGAWVGVTANNSTTNAASGGGSVTVVVSTWYDLFLEITSTDCKFWVSSDAAATWTYIGTSSAQIPGGSGREFGFQATIRKVGGSVGTTAVTAQIGKTYLWPNP